MDLLEKYQGLTSPSLFDKYNESISESLPRKLEYESLPMQIFMNSKNVYNLLQSSDNYDEKLAEIESMYKISELYGLPPEKVFNDYSSISRHFFGDDNKINNWQALKEAYAIGKADLNKNKVMMDILNNDYTDEERAQKLEDATIELLKAPPDNTKNRGLLMRMGGAFAQQVPLYTGQLQRFTGIEDISEKIRERRDEGSFAPEALGFLEGLAEYAGLIAPKYKDKTLLGKISDLIPTWAAIGLGGPNGLTYEQWLYYTEMETASLYYDLSMVEGPNGEKLNDKSNRLISGLLGSVKGAAEALSDRLFLGVGLGMKKFAVSQSKKLLLEVTSKNTIKEGMQAAILKMLSSGGMIMLEEQATEIFQSSLDIIGKNFAISLEEYKDFGDEDINVREGVDILIETAIETGYAVAPMAIFGMGFTGLSSTINTNVDQKERVNAIIRDVIKKLPNGYKTSDVLVAVKEDPRMGEFSDKQIEKSASRTLLQEEIGIAIGEDPEITIEEFEQAKEAQIVTDFKKDLEKRELDFKERTPEFNKLLEQFKKENIDQYYAPLKMDEATLREIWERDHLNQETEMQVESVPVVDEEGQPIYDANGQQLFDYKEVEVSTGPVLTWEKFLEQRRTTEAYITNWQSTPSARKYLANMMPAVDVIKRVMLEDVPVETKRILGEQQEKIFNLVTEAQEGSHVATMADFRIQSNLEVQLLEERIASLLETARSYDRDKVSLATINERLRDLIRTKVEIQSTQNEVFHILETVSREIWDINRVQKNLENTHARLIERIEEYNLPETQAEFTGKDAIKIATNKMKSTIKEAALIAGDTELIKLIDGEYKVGISEDEAVNKLFEETIKYPFQELWETAEMVVNKKNFKKMLIGKMQKSLSNFLKLNGERLMKSILYPTTGNISQSATDKITAIQEAVKEVDGAVNREDIAKAELFVKEKLFPEEDTAIGVKPNYPVFSSRIAELLLRNLKITYDENLTAIPPKLSIPQLAELKTEVDLLRYMGKLELSEAKKGNLISDEIRKSEFLGYQKSISELSSKERKIRSALNFGRLSAAHWAKKLFGDYGVEMFATEKNTADNNARLEKNRRTSEIVKELGMDEKKIASTMFKEKDFKGVKYKNQQLMYYFLGRDDQQVRNDLTYGNKIDVELFTAVDTLLTEEEKKIALTLRQDLMDAWNRTAATYEAATGYRLGKIFNYLPKPVRDRLVKGNEESIFLDMFRGNDYKEGAVNRDMTFERRIATPDNALAIQDGLWDIWQNYIHKQEHYIAHYEWVRQAKKFMDDTTVRETIKENYNPAWVQGIDKYIEDTANPSDLHGATGYDELFRTLRHNVAMSALPGRLGIVLRQIPSLLMYMSEAGMKEFGSAIVQYNASYYPEGRKLKNHIQDMIMEIDPTSIDTKAGYDLLHYKEPKSKVGKIKKRADEIGMAGIYWTDRNIKATGWLAIYNKNKNVLGEEKAIKMARDFTVLYQPSSDKTTLPGMYRHSDVTNMFLMFTQQPVKIFNYLTEDVLPNLDPRNKEANRMAGLYGAIAVSAMGLSIWALTQRRIPEDPEDIGMGLLMGTVGVTPWVGKGLMSEIQDTPTFNTSLMTAPIEGLFELGNLKSWGEAFDDLDAGNDEAFWKKINKISKGAGTALGWYSALTDDLIDFKLSGDPYNVILGGEKGEKK